MSYIRASSQVMRLRDLYFFRDLKDPFVASRAQRASLLVPGVSETIGPVHRVYFTILDHSNMIAGRL